MNEYVQMLENRSNMYRLLGRMYQSETDAGFLAGLAGMEFPEDSGDKSLDEGYAMLAKYVKAVTPENTEQIIEDLAVDYARVFLGAGIAEGTVAYPYESVYTSPGHLVMQDAWEKVASIYSEHGLERIKDSDIHEDHIALEFEFMAFLGDCAIEAMRAGKNEEAAKIIAEQKAFFDEHIDKWIWKFTADMKACLSTDYYKALALITEGYAGMEKDLLADLAANPVA